MSGKGETKGASTSQEAKVVPAGVLIQDDSWAVGSPSAKVTIVEFGDYQCSTCKTYEPIVQEIKEKYGSKIYFVYRHYPLVQVHPFAMSSAIAAQAAGSQGKFWEYHKELYQASPNLEKENLIKIAEKIDLDMTKFSAQIDSDAGRQQVLDDLSDGNTIGVTGTPTFFINGVFYPLTDLKNASDFSSKIDPLLK